ncbi:MAG: SpoIIE family protein phosphatase [Acidobacteriota bacterium]
MTPELLIRTRDGGTRTFRLEAPVVTLGRSRDAHLSYPEDAALSRHHLAFEQSGDGGWVVRDLGSKNGTLHNSRLVTGPRRLQPGDRVMAGHLIIDFCTTRKPVAETLVFVDESSSNAIGGKTLVSTLDDALADRAGIPSGAATSEPVASRHIQTLIRAGRELAGHQPLSELFQTIVHLATDAVGATRGLLVTLDNDQLVVRAAKGEAFCISTAVRDRVLREKTSLLVQDTALDEAFCARESILQQKVRSFMAVPLQTDERVIGLIYVDAPNRLPDFTRDDLSLLTVLANVAAVRIERERLVEIEQTERMLVRELEQAAEIQRALLPSAPPATPGLDVAGYNAPSRTVGGDYYDFISYSNGATGLVVADVAGKGMPAALLVSCLQARVRLLEEEPGPLAGMAARLNRSMVACCPGNRFVTFFICRFGPESGELVYCNAGHNAPFLIHASGEESDRLQTGGPILGILPAAEYRQGECRLAHGDLLVLYSDGVTEAVRPGTDEEFGEDRLEKLVRGHRQESAATILGTIVQTLESWSAGAPPADDLTLLIARRVG